MKNTLCSICVATYKRSELLQKLLNSLMIQIIPDNVEVEIIVVDNDINRSAEPVVKTFQLNDKIVLKYFTQSTKNISLTRNMAVVEARGDYLLFIDDDEIAAPEWLKHLLDTMKKYNADAVFGRVLSYFDGNTPEWIKKSYIFNRPSPLTGVRAIYTRTGNCIVKTSLLKSVPGQFDPAYGISGGEDTHLFDKLRKKGATFINCYEAWGSEYQPPSRTRTSYLIKRAYFTGNLFTRRKLESSRYIFLSRILRFLKALLYLIVSILFAIIFIFNRHLQIYWTTKISSNVGHISAIYGIKIKAYR